MFVGDGDHLKKTENDFSSKVALVGVPQVLPAGSGELLVVTDGLTMQE